MTDNGDEVLFDLVAPHVALVRLNRPDARNAVNGAVAQALDKIVKRVEADGDIRAAILGSTHERVFCAGADIKEIAAGRGPTLSTDDGGFAGFVLANRTKPWIAAISGSALGGGFELALACDMIVTSHDSKLGLPEVTRGLYAGAGGVYRIARVLPQNLATELALTGAPLDATRAYSLGLINRVVPADEVLSAATDLAVSIAANAPLSVRESLNIVRIAAITPDDDIRRLSDEAAACVFASADAREGALAFVEKRQPNWCGH